MFRDAIKLDKKNSVYHFNLGVALTQCNDHMALQRRIKNA